MNNWINVEYEAPIERTWYLTYSNEMVCMLFFDGINKNGIQWLESGDWEGDVTHWMPLPAPPEDL